MASIRSFGMERIGALSDGVVAIAITLLVLELKIPEQAADDAILWLGLREQLPELTAWLISFVIIALIWYDQHYLFAHSAVMDTGFLLTNMLQLCGIALIPLGAHLIGDYPDDPLSSALFTLLMVVNGLMMTANAWYLWRHPGLHRKPEACFLHRRAIYHMVSFLLLGVAAMTVAVLYDPLAGAAVWVIKPVGFALYHKAHNRFLDQIAMQRPSPGGR